VCLSRTKKLTTALLCLYVLFSMMLPIETAVAAANANPSWTVYDPVIISELKNTKRTYMSKIGESYFCAPEVFYFEPQKLWCDLSNRFTLLC
jgi:hypothetical protein